MIDMASNDITDKNRTGKWRHARLLLYPIPIFFCLRDKKKIRIITNIFWKCFFFGKYPVTFWLTAVNYTIIFYFIVKNVTCSLDFVSKTYQNRELNFCILFYYFLLLFILYYLTEIMLGVFMYIFELKKELLVGFSLSILYITYYLVEVVKVKIIKSNAERY